ncbi:hypothetical protein [Paenibacillus azoreducens]|uniref:Uncharacterized protein n=1 Tax=Paenibacillus azoreducens TaxID=116718 RepID=A0A920CRH8_9BACL|nr:hypothetical protein [Paenibacillus azoreducens]GIO51041.1 hypothetical protein J34TS1_58060 [Paenibacillus azoreducens]
MNVASKIAIATLSSVLLLGSSASFAAEAKSSKEAQQEAAKKAAEAAKSVPEADKKFIEAEINRVKELSKKPGESYVLYHKYPQLNSGLALSYWGLTEEFSSYEDYLKRTSTLEGSILKQPANLPAGYKFLSATIEGPTTGKFVDEVKAEGKKSGKPIYAKKIDWKEAVDIRLKYSNGKDTLTFSKYTKDPEGSKKQGFFNDNLPANVYPKSVFWYDGGKYEYGISTSTNIPREKKIEMLKAAVKK